MSTKRITGFATALALLALYVWFQVLPLLGDRGTGIIGLSSHQNDYKHLYLGSLLLVEGKSPYASFTFLERAGELSQTVDPRFRAVMPYVYLPFTGLAMAPLSALPFAESAAVFQILNHFLLLGGLLLGAWAMRWPLREGWPIALLLALVALNVCVLRQNNAGQLNVVLFAGWTLILVLLMRRAPDWLIGSVAAAAMLFKLSPGILLFWFLARAEYRRAAWMVGAALALTLLCVAWVGLPIHLDFLAVLKDLGYGRSTWGDRVLGGNTFWRDPYNQSYHAFLHRAFVLRPGTEIVPWMDLGPGLANAATWAISLPVLAGFIAFCRATRNSAEAVAPALGLAVCASLLLPSICWDHYLVQALVPVVICLAPGSSIVARGLAIAAVVLMSLPIQFDHAAYRSGFGLLLMAAKLPVVILLTVACCVRVRLTGGAESSTGLPTSEEKSRA